MSSSLYKTPSGTVINLTNVLYFSDCTNQGKKMTQFVLVGGNCIMYDGHFTEDVLAKQDIIAKMEGMVKAVMNQSHGKFASTDVSSKFPFTHSTFYPHPKPAAGKHARSAKRRKST